MSLTVLGMKERLATMCTIIHSAVLTLTIGSLFILLAVRDYIPTVHYGPHV